MRKSVVLLLSLAWYPALADSGLTITPPRVEMGAFYNGTQLRVEGATQPDSKVVLVVRGANIEEVFNKKGRVGPIWVNSGKVHISGVPSLLLCFSAEPVNRFLTREAIDQHQLDFDAIKNQMHITPQQESPELIRANYLTLKTDEGRYQLTTNAVKYGTPGAGGLPFAVDLDWSKKIPPGKYEIRVYECRGGAVVREITTPLEVVEIGFPAFMSSLSRNHPTLYGLLAVIVALMAGFGIDFLAARLRGRKTVPEDKHVPEAAPAPVEEAHTHTKSTA